MSLKKIAYLFGAGATHAEIINSEQDPDVNFRDKYELLIPSVSTRVIKKAYKKSSWQGEKELKQGKTRIVQSLAELRS
ncbi:MAG: hypothetical protein HY591_05575 [Candidatus Omnitrophica bacterium]|nr:hypothetical protein [Candidatus Omnitrophota bacterium]